MKKIFYGWWIVIACTLIMGTIFPLIHACLSLFIVPVTEDFGISRSTFSVFTLIASTTVMFFAPMAGKLLATRNIKKLMLASLVLAIFGYGSLCLVNNTVHLYILAVVIGVGEAFSTNIPSSILITRWFVKKRAQAMSVVFTGSSIGAMILSPIISRIIVSSGWRAAYFYLGLGMVLVVVPLTFFVIRSSPEEMGLKALGADEKIDENSNEFTVGIPLKELQKKPVFWIFSFGIFIMLLTMGAMYHMPAYVTGLGFSAEDTASFVSLYSLIMGIGKLLMGYVFEKYNVRYGVMLGFCSMTLTFVFLLLAESHSAMLLFVAVFYGIGSAHSTIFPATLTSKLFGSKYYGEVFGLVTSFASLSLALNNLMMALMYDIMGTYTLSWYVGIAVAVIGGLILLTSVEKSKNLI